MQLTFEPKHDSPPPLPPPLTASHRLSPPPTTPIDSHHSHEFHDFQRLRVTVIAEVYSAILELNAKGVQSLNSGEATNLVANDAQKLLELTQNFHLLWAAPIQVSE